jgi:trehalose-phosphatase
MCHLLTWWPQARHNVGRAGHLLLLFDFDGTLAPIVPQPQHARMLPRTRATLRRLARSPFCTLGFVSGREIGDLQARVRVPHSFYAGNHGMELSAPAPGRVPVRGLHTGQAPKGPTLEERAELDRITELLRTHLANVPGVILEDKRSSVSVHYRNVVEESRQGVMTCIRAAMAHHSRGLQASHGKMVVEIRPAGAPNKGAAVRTIVTKASESAGARPLVYYFGDDEGDEPAFCALSSTAYSVRIGSADSTSNAAYYLNSPREVEVFLLWLSRVLAWRATRERRPPAAWRHYPHFLP